MFITITTDWSEPNAIAGNFHVTTLDSTYYDYFDDLEAVEDTINKLEAYLVSGSGSIENILIIDFLHQGADIDSSINISQDLAMVLLEGDNSNPNISFGNISFIYYTVNDGVIVYSVMEKGIVVRFETMPVKKVGENWLLYGNQSPLNMGIKFLLNRHTEITEGGTSTTTNSITLNAWSEDSLNDYVELSVLSDLGGATLINAMNISSNVFSNSPLTQTLVEGLKQFDKYTITLTLTDASTVSWDQYLKAPVATYTGATLTDIGNAIFPQFATTAEELCNKSNTEIFIWANPGPLMQKEITYTRGNLMIAKDLNPTDFTTGTITASTPITNTFATSLILESFDSGNQSFKRGLKCNFVPAVVSSAATINSLNVVLNMDKNLSGSIGHASAFTINGVASSPTVTEVVISGSTVTLTLSAGIVSGETVTVTYAATGTLDLSGIHGNVANFSNQPVLNNLDAVFDLSGVGIDVAAGNITNTDTTMEYSLNSSDGSNGTWLQASNTNTAVIYIEGDVYIREQANPSNFRLVATIAPALAAPSTPVINYSTETAAGVATTIEYDTNNTFPSAVSGDGVTPIVLTPGTNLYFRTKATATTLPSLVATLTVSSRPAATAYTINYTDQTTVETVPTTVEYNTDNNFSTANLTGTGAVVVLTPGTNLYFRVTPTGSSFASDVQTLTVEARPATPAHTINYASETTGEAVPTTVEYNTDNNFSTINNVGTGAVINLTPGTDLYFRVTPTGSSFASDVQTLTVTARPATPAHTINFTSETTGETVPTTVEYNTDNNFITANIDGTGTAISLTPGVDLYFRVTPTGSSFASVVQTLTVATRPATPAHTINFASETTGEALPTSIEYNIDNDFSTANTAGSGIILSLTPGMNIYLRVTPTGSSFASAVQSLEVPIRPAIGFIVTVDNHTSMTASILTDGTPVLSVEGLEYKLDLAEYASCIDNQQVDLSGTSTLYVRKAATGSSFASLPTANLDES